MVVLIATAATIGEARRRRSRRATGSNFGNTVDQNRYSPLTQITPGNVDQLGRAFTFDLNKVVPGIKKGQQSYPIVVDGRSSSPPATTRCSRSTRATGDLIWHYAPDNVATFKNFGIVANRGVAYCDGRVFLLTLDMTIVALDPATGKQLARVPIAHAVPGAYANYGYSETSAPICANHTVDRRRGRLRLRRPRLRDGVPHRPHAGLGEPVLDHPAGRHRVAQPRAPRRRRDQSGRRRPSTRRRTRSTSAPPRRRRAYYPSLRPGHEPARRLAGRGRPRDREAEVVAAAARARTSGRTTRRSRRSSTRRRSAARRRRIVSIATMEGVWFAYDAATGAPIYQRVKVIDNVEHPALKPGQAGRRLPVVARRAQLLAGVVRPADELRLQRRGRDRRRCSSAADAGARRRRRRCSLGNTFLGPRERRLRPVPPDRLARLRLGQRDRRRDRQARLEVQDARARARRRDDDGLRPRLRRRRRRQPARVRRQDRRRCSGSSRRASRSPPAPSVYSVERQRVRRDHGRRHGHLVERRHGREPAAGLRARRQPDAVAGVRRSRSRSPRRARRRLRRGERRERRARRRPPSAGGAARIVTPGGAGDPAVGCRTRRTRRTSRATCCSAGKPVAGAQVSVDGWVAPRHRQAAASSPTRPTSRCPARHVVTVAERGAREVGGKPLTAAAAERGARRERRDQRRLRDRRPDRRSRARRERSSSPAGSPTARASRRRRCRLYSYQLTGTDHRRERRSRSRARS